MTDPFYQIDSAINRKFEGAGFGLYLARAYLEFYGGDLSISSVPEMGTTVTLRLPPDRVTAREDIALSGAW